MLRKNWRRILITMIGLGLVFFLLLQLIPLDRDNPPIVAEPNWDSLQTRDLAERACFDCHSNETEWVWYSRIAPVSFLVVRDVKEGREKLNFSEWGDFDDYDDLVEVIEDGEMPPWNYLLMHPEARLSDEEKNLLQQGLIATARQSGGERDDDRRDNDDD